MAINDVVQDFASLNDQDKQLAYDQMGSCLGKPSKRMGDRLWLIIILAFAFVMVGAFITLAIGVFIKPLGSVQPELVLATFTTVVGYLAGVFSPSPTTK